MSSNGIREDMERERVDRDTLQEYDGASLREWEAERRRTSGEDLAKGVGTMSAFLPRAQ